jgi:hypothetical protein
MLIDCAECKARISDRAAACPACGAPVTPAPSTSAPDGFRPPRSIKPDPATSTSDSASKASGDEAANASCGNRIILALCIVGLASAAAKGSWFWGVVCLVGVVHGIITEVQAAQRR